MAARWLWFPRLHAGSPAPWRHAPCRAVRVPPSLLPGPPACLPTCRSVSHTNILKTGLPSPAGKLALSCTTSSASRELRQPAGGPVAGRTELFRSTRTCPPAESRLKRDNALSALSGCLGTGHERQSHTGMPCERRGLWSSRPGWPRQGRRVPLAERQRRGFGSRRGAACSSQGARPFPARGTFGVSRPISRVPTADASDHGLSIGAFSLPSRHVAAALRRVVRAIRRTAPSRLRRSVASQTLALSGFSLTAPMGRSILPSPIFTDRRRRRTS